MPRKIYHPSTPHVCCASAEGCVHKLRYVTSQSRETPPIRMAYTPCYWPATSTRSRQPTLVGLMQRPKTAAVEGSMPWTIPATPCSAPSGGPIPRGFCPSRVPLHGVAPAQGSSKHSASGGAFTTSVPPHPSGYSSTAAHLLWVPLGLAS